MCWWESSQLELTVVADTSHISIQYLSFMYHQHYLSSLHVFTTGIKMRTGTNMSCWYIILSVLHRCLPIDLLLILGLQMGRWHWPSGKGADSKNECRWNWSLEQGPKLMFLLLGIWTLGCCTRTWHHKAFRPDSGDAVLCYYLIDIEPGFDSPFVFATAYIRFQAGSHYLGSVLAYSKLSPCGLSLLM